MKPLAGHTLLFADARPSSGESGSRAGSLASSGNKTPPSFPFIIGVAGGSSSGKSEVCERIVEALGQNSKSAKERQVFVINQDSFYRNLNEKELQNAAKFHFNFDHPNAINLDKLKECLNDIKEKRGVTISQYDYVTHRMVQSEESKLTIHSADVVIVEGILVFYDKEMRELFDLKLFVDTDSDTRLARRVLRDTEERGRNIDSVLSQYIKFVKPAFEEFCLPTKKYADVIIPRGNDNKVAVGLIVQHIQDLLQCNANSRRSSIRGRDSKSSGSSRGSSIPGSPLNKSTDHINNTNHAPKLPANSQLIPAASSSASKASAAESKSASTSSAAKGSTKGKSKQVLAANTSQVNSMLCHTEEFPAINANQCSSASANMTNSVH